MIAGSLTPCLIILMALLAQGDCASDRTKDQLIELSYPFDNTTVYWPGGKRFNLTSTYRGKWGAVPWLETNDFETAEHGGTHMDAPAHFSKGRWHVGDIPLSHLVAPAILVDAWPKAKTNRDYETTTQDLQDWEAEHGAIPDGCVLLLRTGWHQYYPNETRYLGNDRGDTTDMHFPGLHPDAARWLVDNRNIYGIGIDTPSVDNGQSTTYQSHLTLYAENIYGLENVGYLDKVPATGAMLYVMPMNIKHGSGAPCRILAVVRDESGDTNRAVRHCSSLWIWGLAGMFIGMLGL